VDASTKFLEPPIAITYAVHECTHPTDVPPRPRRPSPPSCTPPPVPTPPHSSTPPWPRWSPTQTSTAVSSRASRFLAPLTFALFIHRDRVAGSSGPHTHTVEAPQRTMRLQRCSPLFPLYHPRRQGAEGGAFPASPTTPTGFISPYRSLSPTRSRSSFETCHRRRYIQC
jgi:hypothetical protein